MKVTSVAFFNIAISKGVFRDVNGSKRHQVTAERNISIEMNLRSDAASVDQQE